MSRGDSPSDRGLCMIACTTCFVVEDGSLSVAIRRHFEGKRATCDPRGVAGTLQSPMGLPTALYGLRGGIFSTRAQQCLNDGLVDVPMSFSVSLVILRKSSLLSLVLACLRNPLCLSVTRNLPVVCRASSSGSDVWFSASGLNVLYDVTYVFFSSWFFVHQAQPLRGPRSRTRSEC